MDELAARRLLGEAHVEQLAAAVHLLLGELAALSERVAALEGAPPEESQQRIGQLTQWVLEPLRRG